MKKIFILILVVLGSWDINAQTLKQISDAKKQEEIAKTNHKIIPPISVRASFGKEFPNTEVKWEKVRGHYEANYSSQGKSMSVLYGDEGQKIESELVIPHSQMPSSVMNYIASNYKGEKITETSIIKKANGQEIYEVEVAGMDVLFTKDGKFIKALKE